MSTMLEAKKTKLLQKIKWPQESIQRASVCVDSYQVIKTIDSEHQPEFFQWFLESADSIWFSDTPQEQDNLSKRKYILNQVFGESDAVKLLELLQEDTSGTLNIEPNSTTVPIPADTQLSREDIARCRVKYNRSVIGLIDLYANEGYSAQQYYRTLWNQFNNLLSSCTEIEKGICLYFILCDKRTPYYDISKGLYMTQQEYQSVVKSIMPSIQKMQYVLASRCCCPTEPSSRLLFILQELKDDKEKAVFLSELMDEMQPDRD